MKFFLIIFLKLILSLVLKGQSISNDSLINSLEVIFEKIDSNYKEQHFILTESYDYYNSINSLKFACAFNHVLSKIEFPVTREQIAEITFVKCHNWVEAYSAWYITIVDKMGNYHIYFYEDNKGIQKIDLYVVKQEKDYFYSLAKNLLSNLICSG